VAASTASMSTAHHRVARNPAIVSRAMRRVALALSVVVLSGCSLEFGGGRGATRQGRDIFGLWQGSVIVAIFVGGLVWGLILFAILRYRRRNDELPNQTQYFIKLEILYTVVPVIIVAVLFAFSYRTQNDVDALASDPAVTIDVRGFQWQWQFRYRDDDVTVTGLPGKEATMMLPEDRTTRLVLTSRDVIHSFYVPGFLFKRDVIPGVVNRFDVTPRDSGTFTGRCAEFCGLDHAKMTFEVKVVSMAEFREWIAEQQTTSSEAAS
jgi:cytochrome c oxidase subunit II